MLLLFVDFLLDEILEVHLGHVLTIAVIVVVDKHVAVLATAATFLRFLAHCQTIHIALSGLSHSSLPPKLSRFLAEIAEHLVLDLLILELVPVQAVHHPSPEAPFLWFL